MNILIVGFDDSIPAATRSQLLPILKSQNSWARLTPSTYAVTTSMTASQFRDRVRGIMGSSLRFFVYTVNNQYWATSSIPADVNSWLQQNWSQS